MSQTYPFSPQLIQVICCKVILYCSVLVRSLFDLQFLLTVPTLPTNYVDNRLENVNIDDQDFNTI